MTTVSKALGFLRVGLVPASLGVLALQAMPPGATRVDLLFCFGGVALMSRVAIGSLFIQD